MSQVDPLPTDPNDRSWLTFNGRERRQRIGVSSKSHQMGSDKNSITFRNMTDKELHAMEAFLSGHSYVRVVDGRLHAYHAFDPLPEPERDPLLAEHWPVDGETKQFGGLGDEKGWQSPGIIITAVGAAGRAERSRDLLRDWGFACLRSPRQSDGTYWEQWVLHYLLAAQGDLKDHLDRWKAEQPKLTWDADSWKASAEEAGRFIVKCGVSFGSLDITAQRWALANPD